VAKRLRCYLGFHRWVDHRSDDGQPYRKCRYCGKFLDIAPPLTRIGGGGSP
jgi:hypothetical protein